MTDVASRTERAGRFGCKAQRATLLAFGAEAYRDATGITNELFKNEVASGMVPAELAKCDTVPDPEDVAGPTAAGFLRAIDLFEGFMKFLAPPSRGNITPQVLRGGAHGRTWKPSQRDKGTIRLPS